MGTMDVTDSIVGDDEGGVGELIVPTTLLATDGAVVVVVCVAVNESDSVS